MMTLMIRSASNEPPGKTLNEAGDERGEAMLERVDRVAGPAELLAECGDDEGEEEDERCGERDAGRWVRESRRAHDGPGGERECGHQEEDGKVPSLRREPIEVDGAPE